MPPEIISPNSVNNQPPATGGNQNSNPAATEPATPAIQTPAGDNLQINNVSRSLWQYIWQRKRWELLIFVPFVIAWEVLFIIVFFKYLEPVSGSGDSSNNSGFIYILGLPFIVFSGWLYKLRKQFEDAFLQEFARDNNYDFDKNGTVDETYGSIFQAKGHQTVSDVVSGNYVGNSLRLFLYELVNGSGRNQQRYQETVMELDLHGQLPELLMTSKRSASDQLVLPEFGTKNTIKLEGNFDQYFTLYAPAGNEIEALEVFSPDTMALMEDESKHYTVEFAGNRIYIYVNGFVATTENLTSLFALAKKLIDKIAPLAARLQNDSAIIATPVNIIKT
ncbi:MAG: hypothetical protein ACREGF_01435, partial [Candidatus Saccharimonadales bacterium]